jgi:hypothetical protein
VVTGEPVGCADPPPPGVPQWSDPSVAGHPYRAGIRDTHRTQVERRPLAGRQNGTVSWVISLQNLAEDMMLASARAIAFLPSSDLDRSRRFFSDTLGLVAEEMTPFACILRAGSTMLRVTKVDDLRVQPFTVFGWQVPDIRGSVVQLTGAGVAFVRYDGGLPITTSGVIQIGPYTR